MMKLAPKDFDHRRLERCRLYVSYACPWCHRCLIARAVCGLSALRVTNVEPVMDARGWRIGTADQGEQGGGEHMSDVYRRFGFSHARLATVPLLVDEADGSVLSNDSGEIMRLLAQAVRIHDPAAIDLVPAALAAEIDAMNACVQTGVNEKVYRVGFADNGAATHQAESELADALGGLDEMLDHQAFLVSDSDPVECDWRLWTTLVRYEPAYRHLFLSPGAPRLANYRHLARLTERLMQVPGARETVRIDEIVAHYTARVRDRAQSQPQGLRSSSGTPDLKSSHSHTSTPPTGRPS